MLGAVKDLNGVIPVQLEIKEYAASNRKSHLYMMVTLTKTASGVVETGLNANYSTSMPSLFPEATISISRLLSNVNENDYEFLKYVLDGFLNDSQRSAKQRALAEQAKEYAAYGESKASDRDRVGNISGWERALEAETSDVNTRFSLREKAAPKKTVIGYKAFYVEDGNCTRLWCPTSPTGMNWMRPGKSAPAEQ